MINSQFVGKIIPAFFVFSLLLSAGWAKEPVDKSHLFAREMNVILKGLKDTNYQSRTEVDPSKGIFRGNCSGLITYILRNHFPEAYLTVRGKDAPWKIRPLAVTFYETFMAAGRKEGAKPGWERVPKLMDVKPGDIIAWRKPILKQGLNTGHVCMIAGLPTLEPDGRIKVRVADSTSGRHANDSRPKGVNGVGTGDMWFEVNEKGEPIAMWLNENSKRNPKYKIAMGRIIPIKVSTAIHPKAVPAPTKTPPSPDLPFLGLTIEKANRLAAKHGLEARVIVLDGKHLPVSKSLNPNRINLVLQKGKVIRTIRG